MNGLSQRKLMALGLPLLAGIVVAFVRQDIASYALAVGVIGAVGAWMAGSGEAPSGSLDGVVTALRRLREGKRPELPPSADPAMKPPAIMSRQ